MKKVWTIRILLLLGYCIPYAFLCVMGDAAWRTMLFYGVMLAGFSLLYWGCLKTNAVPILYLGNGLSFLSSYAAAKLTGLAPMEHYFKPFTSHSLMAAISIIAVLSQTILIVYAGSRKKA